MSQLFYLFFLSLPSSSSWSLGLSNQLEATVGEVDLRLTLPTSSEAHPHRPLARVRLDLANDWRGEACPCQSLRSNKQLEEKGREGKKEKRKKMKNEKKKKINK